jgi:hypothetical protein
MPARTVRVSGFGVPLLDIGSYARRGPGRRDHLTSEQVAIIARTVRRVPEVMVKVSGGGTSPKAVAAHFRYIDRRGDLDIETDDGETLHGKSVHNDLVEDWNLASDEAEAQMPYSGRPGRKPGKLVHNVILSMPKGTPAAGLLAASRVFAREQFALTHRYAMALHTDQDHPHVHLVVKAMSERGGRLNIKKATLREWRSEFARHLREQGIEANATERAVRGKNRDQKADGIYRAARRGASTHMRERAESVASELVAGQLRIESGQLLLRRTRQEVQRGWQAASEALASQGHGVLAGEARRFIDRMPAPATEKQVLAARLTGRTRELRTKELLVAR